MACDLHPIVKDLLPDDVGAASSRGQTKRPALKVLLQVPHALHWWVLLSHPVFYFRIVLQTTTKTSGTP